jgi:hypothetical protein
MNMFDAFEYVELILEDLYVPIIGTPLSPETFLCKFPPSQRAHYFVDVSEPAFSQLASLFI